MTGSIKSDLVEAWQTLLAGDPGSREWRALRFEVGHPLDVFAAIRERDGTRGILFECPIASAPAWRLRFDSEGMRLLDDREGRDGVLRIALTLERADLESVFLVVAEDLVASSRAAADVVDAVGALGGRLTAWQTCLKLRRDGFGQEQMLGLYGELVLLQRLGESIGLDRAIASWTGPDRGLHDFEAAGLALEVKTSLGPRGTVRVGSLDQLDVSRLQALALYRVIVARDQAGRDLLDLVGPLRIEAAALGGRIRRELDQRLLLSGFIDPEPGTDRPEKLAVVATEVYDVRADFPGLHRANVAPAVVAAEYTLDVAMAADYRMSDGDADRLFIRFGIGV